jgi:hypothetical protein
MQSKTTLKSATYHNGNKPKHQIPKYEKYAVKIDAKKRQNI